MLNHSVGFNSQRLKGIENCWSKGKAKVKDCSLQLYAPSGRAACVPCPGSIWDMKKFYERFYHSDIKVLRSVAVSYHVQLLRQLVAVFLHNRHLLLRACCLYCLLPFYQSILSSQRRSVTSTSSGAESSAKAFSFILQR